MFYDCSLNMNVFFLENTNTKVELNYINFLLVSQIRLKCNYSQIIVDQFKIVFNWSQMKSFNCFS